MHFLNYIPIFVLNLLIIIYFNKLSEKVGIFDIPNKDRKLHQNKTPLLGGLIVALNVIVFFLIHLLSENFIFYENKIPLIDNFGLREFFSFLFIGLVIFLIGLYDDKYNLVPLRKILLLLIVLYTSISVDNELIIQSLDLNIFKINIYLTLQSGLVLSIFCFLVLINSINLFDGVNMQSSSIIIFVYGIFIFNNMFIEISFILLISNLTFFYLNSKDRCFYGDSGIYLNCYFIGYILVKSYNINQALIPESVFLLFILPCIDMLRIFIIRILNKKNPFVGDRKHFHHIIRLRIKNSKFLAFVILISTIAPFLIYEFLKVNFFIVTTLFLLIYIMFIYLLRNGKQR